MEDKDSKNKENLENWKTMSFDFASLYPETFRWVTLILKIF